RRRPRLLWKQVHRSRKRKPELPPAASLCGLLRSFSVVPEGFRVEPAALVALWEGCEAHLLAQLEAWWLCALHAKRSALRNADIQLVKSLRVKRA
ncbi:H3 protein, partial [Crotophaga sulcirostris]|nr:H3 protein [Crotophaga sulcirostris]